MTEEEAKAAFLAGVQAGVTVIGGQDHTAYTMVIDVVITAHAIPASAIPRGSEMEVIAAAIDYVGYQMGRHTRGRPKWWPNG